MNGPTPTTVTVFANEDDQASTGNGTSSPDAKDISVGTLRLRAERNGTGKGRVYLIVVKARDLAGNMGVNCCTVVVPQGMQRLLRLQRSKAWPRRQSPIVARTWARHRQVIILSATAIIVPKQVVTWTVAGSERTGGLRQSTGRRRINSASRWRPLQPN